MVTGTGTLLLGFKQGGPLSYHSRSASTTFVARSHKQARTHAPADPGFLVLVPSPSYSLIYFTGCRGSRGGSHLPSCVTPLVRG